MFNYYNPVNIIFGANTFAKVSKVLENKKYIIITHNEEYFNQYSNPKIHNMLLLHPQ